MRCAACEMPDRGYTHTCAGSGTYIAAEAYDADAVLEQAAKDWNYHEVKIVFRMRAQDEQMIREKLTPLMAGLLDDEFTDWGDLTIAPDEVPAA